MLSNYRNGAVCDLTGHDRCLKLDGEYVYLLVVVNLPFRQQFKVAQDILTIFILLDCALGTAPHGLVTNLLPRVVIWFVCDYFAVDGPLQALCL